MAIYLLMVTVGEYESYTHPIKAYTSLELAEKHAAEASEYADNFLATTLEDEVYIKPYNNPHDAEFNYFDHQTYFVRPIDVVM